jgi:hypothetical protein
VNTLHPHYLEVESEVAGDKSREPTRSRRSGSRNVGSGGGAYHLPGSHANGLDGEFSTAHVEKIFETRP